MDPTLYRRARHVVTENERVRLAVEALRESRPADLGPLFAASHVSLATDYEVSTPELDILVRLAATTEGVLAARLTGAGLGGCTVNVVERHRAQEAAAELVKRYAVRTGRRARYWICEPAAGAVPAK
jgi:galactokinase